MRGIEIKSTVTFRISPSTGLLSLVHRYGKALDFVMEWLKKKPEKEIVKQVHDSLYQQLREKFNLPSKVAQDCYRNAIAIYNVGKTLSGESFQKSNASQCG